ncbi:hypothetical protein XENOCAPTIV_018605 [Xenoophorus captivus]|uniref:Uncharacterized protein n=1 Tax=Xenoophorus captivus TaxID=1517983 RepID=A0ABV0S3E4_9TELE
MTFPLSRTYTDLGSGKGQLKSLQTPHTLHINCLDCYLQVGATERFLLQLAARETRFPPGCFSDEYLTVPEQHHAYFDLTLYSIVKSIVYICTYCLYLCSSL